MERVDAYLMQLTEQAKISLTQDQAQKFQMYAELLCEWNEKINLTAITDPKQIVEKHFLDSLLLLPFLSGEEKKRFIDVGTGAGFPGVPLALVDSTLQVTLLDSLQKRINFLKELTQALSIEAVCVHSRAEEGSKTKPLRESFSYATARAVASLPLLCEYCLPYLKQNGLFLAMKGPQGEEEARAAKNAIKELGCELEKVVTYQLPGGDGRSVVCIRRVKRCPEKYPRHGSKISKQPL